MTAGAGWLMVHAPHTGFFERAEGPGRHLFAFLTVVGVPDLEGLPEAFPLDDPRGYERAFAALASGRALAAAELLSSALNGFAASAVSGRERPPSRFEGALALMRERTVTRAELAREAGLDPSHFDHAFRAHHGEPPMAMARRYRLDRIRADLLAGDAPLESLAIAHGFSEASALGRFFTRLTGETPGTYRERAKGSVSRYVGSFDGTDDAGIMEG